MYSYEHIRPELLQLAYSEYSYYTAFSVVRSIELVLCRTKTLQVFAIIGNEIIRDHDQRRTLSVQQ